VWDAADGGVMSDKRLRDLQRQIGPGRSPHSPPEHGKSAEKSAASGRPFETGTDSRRGRGPAKGAPNAGRPPDEFKRRLAALASGPETLRALEQILSDPGHQHFIQALKFASERGYGIPKQTVDLEGGVQIIVGAGRIGVDADG
jgi:hypothetical protein